MATEIQVEAQSRDDAGTGPARRLRGAGRIPGIVNDEKGRSRTISVDRHDFDLMLHRHRSEQLVVDLVVDGKKPKKCLLKDVQHHPVSGEILHADFVEISMTRKMRVEVPITVEGEPLGVINQGGILDQQLRTIEIECFPGDLAEQVLIDVSALEVGQHLSVSDLPVKSAWTVLTDGELSVVSVLAPRLEEEPVAEEEAAEEGEAAEGEEGAPAAEAETKEATEESAS